MARPEAGGGEAPERGPPWRLAAQRAIVRAGMLRLSLLAWADHGRGRLGRDELRARLWAYGEATRSGADHA